MKKGILTAFLIVIVFFVIIIIIGGLFYLQLNQRPTIAKASYLKIHLKGSIVDIDTNIFSKKQLTVKNLFYQILRAKNDNRIKGLIVKISPIYTSIDKAEEIGKLLKEFQKSNKKVYAFIENGGLKELICASYANKLYALKGNYISLPGLSIQAIFLKDTLSKIGIEPDFLQIAEYKTGPNIFTRDGFTKAHKESYQLLLDDIYNASLKTIAKNRNIKLTKLNEIISDFPLSNQIFFENKLIDGIIYEDELIKKENLNLPITSLKNYMKASGPSPFKGPKKIAIVFANGEIHEGASGSSSITGNKIMGSDTITQYLKECRKDPTIKAVVLRVVSPGGSPVASDIIRREAQLVNEKKPLIVSMSEVAASGGYFIAMSSSKIFAFPQTITGSIGVYGGKFVLKKFYDKIGLKKEMITTSKYSGMFSDYSKFSSEQRKKYSQIMQDIYNSFTIKVSKYRKIKKEDIDSIARGRVWAGESAKKIHLIDEYGGMLDAIKYAKKLAKIPESESVSFKIYPKKISLMDFIIKSIIDYNSQDSISSKIILSPTTKIKEDLQAYRNFFPALILPFKLNFE